MNNIYKSFILFVPVYLPAHFLNSDGAQLFEVQGDGTGDSCQGMGPGSPPELHNTLSDSVSVVSTHLDTGHELKASAFLFFLFGLFLFGVVYGVFIQRRPLLCLSLCSFFVCFFYIICPPQFWSYYISVFHSLPPPCSHYLINLQCFSQYVLTISVLLL